MEIRFDRARPPLLAAAILVLGLGEGCCGARGTAPGEPRGGGEPAPAEPAPVEPQTVEVAEVPVEPAPTGPAEPTAPPDLLRCPLELRTWELGRDGDSAPSAPAAAGDGLVVAWTRARSLERGVANDLVVQRLSAEGRLGAEQVLREGVHGSRPHLLAAEGRLLVVAISGSSAEALPLDLDTGSVLEGAAPVPLPDVPQQVVLGPRGLVGAAHERRALLVYRGVGQEREPDLRLPLPAMMAVPREQLLSSGPEADLVLVRHEHAVTVAALAPGSSERPRSKRLFGGSRRIWTEASVAAGPSGFVVVRTGPAISDLSLYRFDLAGRLLGEPVALPAGEGDRVRRYPRAAPLGDGWAVTYWDGTGPSLLRVDGEGRVLGEAIELRSGDERGGHTDARVTATARALAVTWTVGPPAMSHGFPEEEPRRPGPRLGVLACRRSVAP